MSAIEFTHYVLIVGGLFVLGFNGAVMVHAARIVRAVLPWRLFVLGTSGLTVFVLWVLWDTRHSTAFTWRIPLAATAITVTLVSLILLDHVYQLRYRRAP